MNPPTTQPTADDIHTVSFISLGCPKNLVDSEKMLGLLAEDGLVPVSHDPETGDDSADAIVINTCGFLEASKDESLGVIREAIEKKQRGEVKRVIVAGCLVQRHRDKMLEWAPGIDAMVGVFDRDHIVRAVRGKVERQSLKEASDNPQYWISANALTAARERGLKTVGLTVQGKDGKGLGYFEDDSARLRLTPRHFAYLRVSEGCNQNCAFCTIPSIRGKMRSKPLDRIVAEAHELLEDGAFELNMIGQDTTSYGDDIGIGFDPATGDGGLVALLRAVNGAIEEHGQRTGTFGWARLMYAYPTNFNDAMIDAIAELPHVCKYIDIPLQHASNNMLSAMRRNVTAEHQTELLRKLRERIPGIAIRTTFISGFPGETEADHQKLLELVDEIGFEALGVFEYSKEPGTRAGTMEDDATLAVDPETKARRKNEIMALQQGIAFEQAAFLASHHDANVPGAGLQFDVLIDKAVRGTPSPDSLLKASESPSPTSGGEGGMFQGRAYFQAVDVDSVTYVRSNSPIEVGSLVRCEIVGSDGYDLIAVPVG